MRGSRGRGNGGWGQSLIYILTENQIQSQRYITSETKSNMFNSSKCHGKGSIVTYVYLYVRCGTIECLLEAQYLNVSLKNFFPKEGCHSRAVSKWSIQFLRMNYTNWQMKEKNYVQKRKCTSSNRIAQTGTKDFAISAKNESLLDESINVRSKKEM